MAGVGELLKNVPQAALDAGVTVAQELGNTFTGSAFPMARDIVWEGEGAVGTHNVTKPGKNGGRSRLYEIASAEADKIVARAEMYAAYSYSSQHQGDSDAAFFDTYQPPIAEPITSSAQKYQGYSESMLIREERLSREVEQHILDDENPKTHRTPRQTTYDAQDGKTIRGSKNVEIELEDSPSASRADIWEMAPDAVPFSVREASNDVHLPREELLRRLAQPDRLDETRIRRDVIHDQYVRAVGGAEEAEQRTQLEADDILAEYELDNDAKIEGGRHDQRNSAFRALGSNAKTAFVIYGLPLLASMVDAPIGVVNTIADFVEAIPADIANAPIPETWPAAHAIKFVAAHIRELIIGTSFVLGTARVGMKRLTDSMQIKALTTKKDYLRELVAQKVHERYSVVNA